MDGRHSARSSRRHLIYCSFCHLFDALGNDDKQRLTARCASFPQPRGFHPISHRWLLAKTLPVVLDMADPSHPAINDFDCIKSDGPIYIAFSALRHRATPFVAISRFLSPNRPVCRCAYHLRRDEFRYLDPGHTLAHVIPILDATDCRARIFRGDHITNRPLVASNLGRRHSELGRVLHATGFRR